jgi:hypothetical protein
MRREPLEGDPVLEQLPAADPTRAVS